MKKLIGLGIFSLALGCNATETGNPYGGSPDDNGQGVDSGLNCDETTEDIDATEQTELGFSAEDLASAIAGRHTTTLAWLDGSGVQYGPESGTGEITLEVTTGDARFVTSRPRESGGDEAAIDLVGPGCRNELELDVTLTLTSSGGALDETVDTVVRAVNPDFARAHFTLASDELGGTLEVSVAAPAGTVADAAPELSFDVGLSDLGITGAVNLLATFQSTDGSAVSVGFGSGALAEWPVDSCGPDALRLPLTEEVRGMSIAALTDAYNALSPAVFDYRDGEPAQGTFALEATDQSACHALDAGLDEQRSVQYAGALNVQTDDGRVDGSFPVTVTASVEGDGTLVDLSVFGSAFSNDPPGMAELPSAFGIQDTIDLDGYDMATVDYNSTLGPDSAWGTLSVRGFQQAPCVTDPPEPEELPGGGAGTPGCRGSDVFELWRASFGQPPNSDL